MKNLLISLFALMVCTACSPPSSEADTTADSVSSKEKPRFEVGSEEYVDIIKAVSDALVKFDFDAYGEHLADDVEVYWPDGTSENRTVTKGKQTFLDLWRNMQATTGIEPFFIK